MSVEQYPDTGYFLIMSTTALELGSFTNISGDLRSAHLRVYHKYTGAYSYPMTLVVSSKTAGPALATSSVITFDNATTGQNTSDWFVDLYFDFDDYNMISSETYFFRLEASGYTRTDSNYIGVWADWLEPVGTSNTGGARLVLGVMQ